MEYKLVWEYTPQELEISVNELLQDGWKLYGNHYTVIESSTKTTDRDGNPVTYNEITYIQPMVKE